jgi:hypothetical protein
MLETFTKGISHWHSCKQPGHQSCFNKRSSGIRHPVTSSTLFNSSGVAQISKIDAVYEFLHKDTIAL